MVVRGAPSNAGDGIPRRASRSVDAERAGHAQMHHQRLAVSRSPSKYFARRRQPRPAGRSGVRRSAPGKGKRRFGAAQFDAVDRAPTIAGARPRRTVSTSGSSGIRDGLWMTARNAAPYFCSLAAPTP